MASFKSLERSSSPVDDPTREAVADGADVLQDFNVISRAYLKVRLLIPPYPRLPLIVHSIIIIIIVIVIQGKIPSLGEYESAS